MLENSQLGIRINELANRLVEECHNGGQETAEKKLEDIRDIISALDHLCQAAQTNIKWSGNPDGERY